ncbi:hypothetical protein FRC03_009231 [Tulasnella sp. 419]|nr:hypothetical protein FRC03_009231 [Tulasnella sp. 419]
MASKSKAEAAPATRASSRNRAPAMISIPRSATPTVATIAKTRSTRAATAAATASQPEPSRDTAASKKTIKATADTTSSKPGRRVLSAKDNIQPPKQTVIVQIPAPKRIPSQTKQAEREPLRAFLRIRPPPQDAPTNSPYLTTTSSTTVVMADPSPQNSRIARLRQGEVKSTYTFSRVFPPEISQHEFFQDTALPLVKDLLEGDNGLIFAYGVTNSGKTFTVQGGKKAGQVGILPRSLDVIFNSIEGLHSDAPLRPVRLSGVEIDADAQDAPFDPDAPFDFNVDSDNALIAGLIPEGMNSADRDETALPVDRNYEYAVWISYAEIYNEKAYDLLGSSDPEPPAPGMTRTTSHNRIASGNGPSRPNTSMSTSRHTGGSARTSSSASFSCAINLATLANMNVDSSGKPVTVVRKALGLKADPEGGKYIAGLREVRVRTAEEAKAVVRMGQINRRVFGTLANSQSSRSHAIFTIKIIRVHKGSNADPESVITSRLSIVDLAGSERSKNTQATGERLKEAGNINKSLMVLGQCMEAMRNNQKRLAAQLASRSNENRMTGAKPLVNGSSLRLDKGVVPFWYSKLTELFQDFFEGDGKAVMIVNVNPYDTGFDENSHVMKFSALARDVTTVYNKAPVPTKVVKPTRIVSLTSSTSSQPPQALWEVAEEEEDDPDDDNDDILDTLFETIEDLKEKLYQSELRYALAEVEIREEISREFEERMRAMELTFARRRLDDEEANEMKMDKKIDLLYQAGLIGGSTGAIVEEEEMIVEAVLDDSDKENEDREASPTIAARASKGKRKSSTTKAKPKVSDTTEDQEMTDNKPQDKSIDVTTEGDEMEEDDEDDDEDEEESEEDAETETDEEWVPGAANSGAVEEPEDEEDEEETQKPSRKSTGGRKSVGAKKQNRISDASAHDFPRAATMPKKRKSSEEPHESSHAATKSKKPAPSLPTYDISMEDVTVIPLKKARGSGTTEGEGRESGANQTEDDAEEEVAEVEVVKKKKR